jgi:hypothetical protein
MQPGHQHTDHQHTDHQHANHQHAHNVVGNVGNVGYRFSTARRFNKPILYKHTPLYKL